MSRIEDIWAVLLVEDDGSETAVPLNASDDAETARGFLLTLAARANPGRTLRVARFTRVEGP